MHRTWRHQIHSRKINTILNTFCSGSTLISLYGNLGWSNLEIREVWQKPGQNLYLHTRKGMWQTCNTAMFFPSLRRRGNKRWLILYYLRKPTLILGASKGKMACKVCESMPLKADVSEFVLSGGKHILVNIAPLQGCIERIDSSTRPTIFREILLVFSVCLHS